MRIDSLQRSVSVDRLGLVDLHHKFRLHSATYENYDSSFSKQHPHLARGHQHNLHHWVLYCEGRNRCLHNGKPLEVQKGCFLWSQPGQRHCYQPMEARKVAYLQWTFSFGEEAPATDMAQVLRGWGCEFPFSSEGIWHLGATATNRLIAAHRHLLRCQGALPRPVITSMGQVIQTLEEHFDDQGEGDPLLRVRNAIQKGIGESWSLKRLEELTGNSPGWLCKRWKQRFQVSPMEDLRNMRMEASAQWLVGTDIPIKVIADQLGFQNVQYFTKVFRNHFQQSPARYRKGGQTPRS